MEGMKSPELKPPLDMTSNIEKAAFHLLVGKYFQLAGFVMLVYDHSLTFSQEVDRIWKQRLSVASVLFFVNRYATLIQFIIILDAFHNPHWTKEFCNKFVLFEGSSTVALVAVGQLIMILRVFAIYERNRYVLGFLITLWFLQIAISAVGLQTGFAVPLPPGLIGCILTGKSALFPSLWIAPLITDSAIFFLTIYRTRRYFSFHTSFTSPYAPFSFRFRLPHLSTSPHTQRHYVAATSATASNFSFGTTVETIRLMRKVAYRTVTVLVRDGALYFFLIFLANLMNALIFFLAEPDLKAVGASFSQLITSTMISRLVLNLRSVSVASAHHKRGDSDYQQYRDHGTSMSLSQPQGTQLAAYSNKRETSLWTRTLGNLGADVTSNSSVGVSSAGTGLNVEVVTTTEIIRDIPMESLDSQLPEAPGEIV